MERWTERVGALESTVQELRGVVEEFRAGKRSMEQQLRLWRGIAGCLVLLTLVISPLQAGRAAAPVTAAQAQRELHAYKNKVDPQLQALRQFETSAKSRLQTLEQFETHKPWTLKDLADVGTIVTALGVVFAAGALYLTKQQLKDSAEQLNLSTEQLRLNVKQQELSTEQLKLSVTQQELSAKELKLSAANTKAELWLELRRMFGDHIDVHYKLRPGEEPHKPKDCPECGSAEESWPCCKREWVKVEAYMGLFEHCEWLLKDGLIDSATFDNIYKYRLRNIVRNQKIVNEKLIELGDGWLEFRALAERFGITLPPVKEKPG